MYQDYKDLLSAFRSDGVKYLVVGGFAVMYHSQPRFTEDLDLFIKADPANAKATYAALAEFGAPLQGIRPDDFTDREPKGFEILHHRPEVNFIFADDLIVSNLASGRAQDLADADADEQALRLRLPNKTARD
jgi:hypothetical protein